jgi:hypothetical protein
MDGVTTGLSAVSVILEGERAKSRRYYAANRERVIARVSAQRRASDG